MHRTKRRKSSQSNFATAFLVHFDPFSHSSLDHFSRLPFSSKSQKSQGEKPGLFFKMLEKMFGPFTAPNFASEFSFGSIFSRFTSACTVRTRAARTAGPATPSRPARSEPRRRGGKRDTAVPAAATAAAARRAAVWTPRKPACHCPTPRPPGSRVRTRADCHCRP